nr:TetR/AcrR family transcriptional regulator [Kribbella sandramycini]
MVAHVRGQGAAYDARRTAILDAVFALVDTEGVAQVTIRRVADRAGVSVGRVQHYFKTKDELLEAASSAINDRGAERVAEHAAGTPGDTLRAILRVLIPRDEEDRRLFRVQQAFETYALTTPALGARVTQGYTELSALFALLLGGPDRTADGQELLATAVGLATLTLTDVITPAEAEVIVLRRVDQLLA